MIHHSAKQCCKKQNHFESKSKIYEKIKEERKFRTVAGAARITTQIQRQFLQNASIKIHSTGSNVTIIKVEALKKINNVNPTNGTTRDNTFKSKI